MKLHALRDSLETICLSKKKKVTSPFGNALITPPTVFQRRLGRSIRDYGGLSLGDGQKEDSGLLAKNITHVLDEALNCKYMVHFCRPVLSFRQCNLCLWRHGRVCWLTTYRMFDIQGAQVP